MRYFTPEPSLSLVPVSHHTVDRRRYSTAGDLAIYRPKSQASPLLYFRTPIYDSTVGKSLLSGNDVKQTEVRYHSNGPLSNYSPISNAYLTSMERQYYPRSSSVLPITGRRVYDEVDHYDTLLKRTFGSSSGYPYSSYYSSPYYSSTLPRYSSYYDRPYYSDSYSYPYYYNQPYYSSYYSPYYSSRGYSGYGDLGYYGSSYYPSRYSYSYTV